jgi:hypothetical protein
LDPEHSFDLRLAKETRMIHEQVVVGTSALAGELIVPDACGLVIFANGSGTPELANLRIGLFGASTGAAEAGTLGVVADSASEWFTTHLMPGSGE